MTGFAIDVVVTVSTIVKFNRRLKVMDDIAAKIKVIPPPQYAVSDE